MIHTLQTRRPPRLLAWSLAALMGFPLLAGLTGCGNKNAGTSQSVDNSTAPSTVTNASAPNASAMSGSNGQPAAPAKQGMSTRNKVIILAGAALLYYLYKKHQAAQQAQAGTQANGAQPQLFRSQNGGVYYRDPQNPQKVTWLTVPNQPVQVQASDVQQYAPDYRQYQGQPAPAPPPGQSSQSVTQYDPSLAGR